MSLIQELLLDPARFAKYGKANLLLKEYFNGQPIETLRPLLEHTDLLVQSAAIFVANELGVKASPLIESIIPLLNSENLSIRYDALESVMVCSVSENTNKFVHVIRSMEVNDNVIRVLAMRLVSNSNVAQLNAMLTLRNVLKLEENHVKGLHFLVDKDQLRSDEVTIMLEGNDALLRKYGAILAKVLYVKYPDIIVNARLSSDSDISKFAQRFVDSL